MSDLLQLLINRSDSEAIIAVMREDLRSVSAGQLVKKALRFACRLREHGHSPGDRVALVADNSADLIAALLGVMASGCIAVPIDVQMEPAATKLCGQSAMCV